MKFSFVFPGQGSQSLGMLSELASEHVILRRTFNEASDILKYDMWQLVQQGPQDKLDSTIHTQPVMLTAGVALWRMWNQLGGAKPAYMAGHSLGEYTALVCAESMDFPSAVKLVQLRGQLMQNAVPEGKGGMAAIVGLGDVAVQRICREQAEDQVLEAVNINAPGQIVIAGDMAALKRGMKAAEAAGAKMVRMLPVSAPCHSSLMKTAADRLAHDLQGLPLRVPKVPVIHNLDAKPRRDTDEIRRALITQIHSPVQWVDTVKLLSSKGVKALVECGPGKVLTGLNRRINKELVTLNISDLKGLEKALEATTSRPDKLLNKAS